MRIFHNGARSDGAMGKKHMKKTELEIQLRSEQARLHSLESTERKLFGQHQVALIAVEKCRQNIEILTKQITDLG